MVADKELNFNYYKEASCLLCAHNVVTFIKFNGFWADWGSLVSTKIPSEKKKTHATCSVDLYRALATHFAAAKAVPACMSRARTCQDISWPHQHSLSAHLVSHHSLRLLSWCLVYLGISQDEPDIPHRSPGLRFPSGIHGTCQIYP